MHILLGGPTIPLRRSPTPTARKRHLAELWTLASELLRLKGTMAKSRPSSPITGWSSLWANGGRAGPCERPLTPQEWSTMLANMRLQFEVITATGK